VYVPVETSALAYETEPGAALVGRPMGGGRVMLVIEGRRYDDQHEPCFADLVERAADRLRAGRHDQVVDESELQAVGTWLPRAAEVRIEYKRQADQLAAYLGTELDPADLRTSTSAIRQIRGSFADSGDRSWHS
jgi:hypothetical protein